MYKQLEQSDKVRILHHFTVIQPLNPEKDNTCAFIKISKTVSSLISLFHYIILKLFTVLRGVYRFMFKKF